jgi:hypothetical protein
VTVAAKVFYSVIAISYKGYECGSAPGGENMSPRSDEAVESQKTAGFEKSVPPAVLLRCSARDDGPKIAGLNRRLR